MKFVAAILMISLLLAGCGAEETMETVADELVVPVMAQPKNIHVTLPGETALPVMESDNGRIYVCEDYEVVIQNYLSGDLNATIEELSGYTMDRLTVITTQQDGMDRYDFVWASVAEQGDQLGRGVILDDGNYHYTMAVTRPADPEEISQVSWNQVFGSFAVSDLEDQY